MAAICIAFQIHSPIILKPQSFFDIGSFVPYVDLDATIRELNDRSDRCFLPANALMTQLIEQHQDSFRFSMVISGIALELFEQYRPDVLASFQKLIQNGQVELLTQTYHHSFSFLFSREEFQEQVELHMQTTDRLFGREPSIFVPTQGLYSNHSGYLLSKLGFKGLLIGGQDSAMKNQHPHQLFHPIHVPDISLLIQDNGISQAVERHFSNTEFHAYPLKTETLAHWAAESRGEVIHIFWDYGIMGLRYSRQSGIFDFMRHLPAAIDEHSHLSFQTPSQIVEQQQAVAIYDQPQFGIRNEDEGTFISQTFQQEALRTLFELESSVRSQNDPALLQLWRHLQCADHFRQMDQGNQANASDAFSSFMNMLADFQLILNNRTLSN